MDRVLLTRLVAEGKTRREIAAECAVSLKRLRYWLGKYGLAPRVPLLRQKRQTIDDLRFPAIVAESISIAEVLRKLGRAAVGTNYRMVHRTVQALKLDTSHWKGRAHGTGQRPGTTRRVQNAQLFVENSPYSTGFAKKRVLRDGLLPYVCAGCGNVGTWQGQPLVLRLDHENGTRSDHRLANLRFMCPNCDSQTSTFCGRNKKPSHKKDACPECGEPKRVASHRCARCARCAASAAAGRTKIAWPPLPELRRLLAAGNYRAVGRALGVSDNAVRKHIRREEHRCERD